jgi:IS605 OrfB family transposase
LVEAKVTEPWLVEAPSHCLLEVLRDLDRACVQHGTFHVRWRSKRHWAPSFRFPDSKQISVPERIAKRWGEVQLPKLGAVRFRWTRPLSGVIRNATVLRERQHWYISFCVENGVVEVLSNGLSAVGVDRGVAVPVATSDGHCFEGMGMRPGERRHLRALQRCLARQKRDSNRRRRTVRAIKRVFGRVRHCRDDFAHKTAHDLTTTHGLVVLENLRVAKMAASARGTITEPGRRVRQKAGLNRAILDKCWGRLRVTIEWHARKNGCAVVLVPPAFTSQTCSNCSHVAAESRESQARFRCVACGFECHADVNAARVILALGLRASGRGGLAIGPPMKRQPSEEELAYAAA